MENTVLLIVDMQEGLLKRPPYREEQLLTNITSLAGTARENGIAFRAYHITDRETAQNAPSPITTYALFHDGEYVTNEQMNDRKFLKLAAG